MKSKRLKSIFISIIFLLALTTGTLFENFSQAGLVFATSSDAETQEEDETKDLDFILGQGKTLIRIASWYQEYDLVNLKAYLANKFPDYSFEFVYIDKSNYEPIIDSQLSYKGAPDIIYMDQEMVEKHAITRYIADVTDLCGDFSDEAKISFDYGTRVYAVPNTSQFECIYYNKDIFSQKGVQLPYSFKSFIGSCDNLRIVKKIKPLAVSLKDPYAVSNSLLVMFAGNYFCTDRGSGFGGRLQYGRTTFSEELSPFLSDWHELVQHQIFTKEMYTKDKRTALEEFASGRAAMIVGGPETYNAINRINPDMSMGTLPFYTSGGKMKAIIGGCDVGLTLNASSKKIDDARKVLTALSTKDGQEALWRDRPGSQTYLKDTEFDNIDVYEGLDECRDLGLVTSPWMEWGTDLNGSIHYQLGKEFQKVILGKQTSAQAFMKVDKKVKQIQYKNR